MTTHEQTREMTRDQYFNELLEMFTSHIETSDVRREEQIKAYILQWLESHPLPKE